MNRTIIKAAHTTLVPHISPFRYPGGKSWLSPQIKLWLSHLNKMELLEPYAGGASVGLYALTDGLVDVLRLNELDEDIYNFWKIALNEPETLCEMVLEFRVNEENARFALEQWKRKNNLFILNDIDRAFLTLLRNRLARNGVMTSRSGLLKNGDVKGIFSRWYPETLVKRIMKLSEFKGAILLTNMDGVEFMRNFMKKESAIFIDPPYFEAGKHLYKHNRVNEKDIFKIVSKLKENALMTYDKAPYILSLISEFNLDFAEIEMMGGANNKKYELLISRDLGWLGGIE